MNKVTARKTALVVEQVNAVLNQYLMELESDIDKSEHRKYCQKFGKVMGEIYFEILGPLWKEHPELLPVEMDGEYVVDQSIFKEIYALAKQQAENHP